MQWSTKRRILYGVATTFFLLAIGVFAFQSYLFPDPTCFDGEKNGFEVGIDCGGVCALKCSTEIIPLRVAWARALPVSSSTYDLVGLVENKNIDNAPRELGYQFIVYNRAGDKIFTYLGTTTIPVEDDKPIILQNQQLGDAPSRTELVLSPAQHFAAKEKPKTPPIKTLRIRHEDGDITRVYVTVYNITQDTFAALPVRVILYDEDRNAIGAGETVIPLLNPEEQKEVTFTWNQPFPVPIASTRVYYDLKSF